MVSGTGGEPTDSAWRPRAPEAPPAEELEGYVDLVEVGRGGDSVVYRARQVHVARDVAIKVLLVDDPPRIERFQREVDITVDLGRQHPNIVNVLATGTTTSGRPAIVMDFVEGGTLHDRLRGHGPLPVEEVVRIGEVLADALAFAHERGILHRDVKPQNVLVLPTSWVLADFGIARLVDSEHTSSAETFTYRHAAPQILDGYPPTAADDLWSLGSTLFTLLEGRPPFASDDPDDDSALAYLRRARTEPHRDFAAPGAERVAPVIHRCLEKDVADRWAGAAELRDAFAALRTSGWEPGARAPTAPGPAGAADTVRAVDRTAPRPTPAPTPDPAPAGSPTPTPSPSPMVAPSAAETPPEPAPLAVSLAGAPPRRPDVDDTGTGVAPARGDDTGSPPGRPPADPDGPGGTVAPDDEGEDRGSLRRRIPLVLGAVALVVGLVISIAATALRGDDGEEPAADPSDTGPIPTLDTAPTDLETFRGEFDPALALTFVDLQAEGGTLRLTWRNPDDAQGVVLLWQTLPEVQLVDDIPAGRTTWETSAALAPGRNCFYLVLRTAEGELGRSGQRCLTEG